MWKKLKHKFAMWIWRDDKWTKAVDDIEQAAKDLRKGQEEVILHWEFQYLDTPPSNKIECRIKLRD